MNIRGKVITVVGLAKSGQAAARLAAECGAVVRVTEQSYAQKIDRHFINWIEANDIKSEFNGHSEKLIHDSDLIVVSPGVPFNAVPLQWARQSGIPVIGELEFACRFCPCPIIAVTGSNGKTTVTTLIGQILTSAGKKVFVGGNIGNPLSESVLDLTEEHIAVLEVSSFQLETIESFHPNVAVLLNISQNHLDRHADMNEYILMKARIFMNQRGSDTAVLNAKDETVMSMGGNIESAIIPFNTAEQVQQTGYENPNFLAAAAAVSVFEIDRHHCDDVFKNFNGIEHRLEMVRTVNGVIFINDSKSTTTEASRWALDNLNQEIIWICGGRDKNLDFNVLKDIAGRKVKKVVAIGEAAEKISRVFCDVTDVEIFTDFKAAVLGSFECACPGDAVLLSPMCSSYDMFDNFEHRGREFKSIVHELQDGKVPE